MLNNKISAQQKNTNAEKEWLIDYYFKENKINENLSNAYNLTILGKYKEARTILEKLKKEEIKNAICYSAVLCYEANIDYNESKYEKSIEKCDTAIILLKNKDNNNRYYIKAQNIIAKAQSALNNYDIAEKILIESSQKAKLINDENGLAYTYYLLSSIKSDKGFYTQSKDLLLNSINLFQNNNNPIGLAASYSFLGLIYAHLGDYMQGIDYIQKSIKIREKTQDKRGLANSYLNLYKIYIDIGESDKALQSELKSLELCKEINDLQCISGRLTNIGAIYQSKGKYKDALTYHFLALNISKQINIKNRIADVYENISKNYTINKKYTDAILYIDSCLEIRKAIGDEEGLISANLSKANINYNLQKYNEALLTTQQSLAESKKLKLSYLTKESHLILSEIYNKTQNYKEGIYHYKSYIILRDSLYNIDKTKEIVRKELEFNFNKKEELQKLKTEKEIEAKNIESKKQKNIIILTVIGILILSLLLIFSIKQFLQKRNSEKQLQKLNSDLNLKNFQLEEKSSIIENQHNTIHQKNKEITDSIRYAQKIQTAIMPLKHEFSNYFKECFVLFEPKDIISGDFYWVTSRNEKIIYATGDCTGHGVPGGFMSMLGVSLLNEIINEHDLTEPALILSRLRKKVITALRQKGLSGEQQDGMDMTICVIDKTIKTLQYAAANHSFYIIRKSNENYELLEFSGDKQPVGIFGKELKPFKQHTIQLNENDTIYTFTDGFADQFGGPKGKKFKYKQLKQVLLSIQQKPLIEQEIHLNNVFNNWKNNLEQIDDVTLIGIRI